MDKHRILQKRKRNASKLKLKPSFIDSNLKKEFNLEQARKEFRKNPRSLENPTKTAEVTRNRLVRPQSSKIIRPERYLILDSREGVCKLKEVPRGKKKDFEERGLKTSAGWFQRFCASKEFHINRFNFEFYPAKVEPQTYSHFLTFINKFKKDPY